MRPVLNPRFTACESTLRVTRDPPADRLLPSRWLRLLFTREFTVEDSMVLWDAIFAADPSLDIAPWVCVAMLIRIRNKCQCIITFFVEWLTIFCSDTCRVHRTAHLPHALPTPRYPHRRYCADRPPRSTSAPPPTVPIPVNWSVSRDTEP